MARILRASLLLGLTLAARAVPAQTPSLPPPDLPYVAAGEFSGTIRLDGILDEPGWQEAGVIAELVQQAPSPGQATAFRTEVRILADRHNLYFGITCADPDPGRIAAHTLQRDGNMTGDDTLTIVLDTFHDHRTGYLFEINAGGARLDGLISDPNAESASLDWDGIWDVATRRTADGWTAEIVLPAETIRFNRSTGEWGFNIQRYVAREQLRLRWAGTTLDANLLDLRRAGNLGGVGLLDQGWGLSVSPYALGRYEIDEAANHRFSQGQAGVDASYHVTSQIDGVVTLNPDFAEVEADTRQVNLTRFALFFPEKRPFFTEGANFFDFGLNLQDSFIPFHTRTVGLYNDRIIPITVGLKAVGREGPWGVGALDVETRDAAGIRGTNLAAGRATYDVNQNLRVGAIATNGDPNGRTSNSLAGVDAVWQSASFLGDKNLGFGIWAARSFGEAGTGDRNGWGVTARYPNDLWDIEGAIRQFGDALDPVLGFLPRPGTRQYSTYVAYQPRPSGGLFSGVRQFFFELNPELVTGLHGEIESFRTFLAPINFRSQAGDHYEANYAPEYQRITEPFEIAPGVRIPAGSYQFHRFRLQVESSDARPLSAGGTVWFGGFYDGHLTQWQGFVKWTEGSGRLQLALNMENDYGYLPEGNFTFRLWQLKAVYAFRSDLLFATFLQYDSESRDLGLNARLRWTIRPGNDLYVVWNRGWQHPIFERSAELLLPQTDEVIVKLRWTFTR